MGNMNFVILTFGNCQRSTAQVMLSKIVRWKRYSAWNQLGSFIFLSQKKNNSVFLPLKAKIENI
jgi:hypothetical protein